MKRGEIVEVGDYDQPRLPPKAGRVHSKPRQVLLAKLAHHGFAKSMLNGSTRGKVEARVNFVPHSVFISPTSTRQGQRRD